MEHTYLITDLVFTCKNIYNKLILEKIVYPENYALYWADELNVYIDDIDWIEEYSQCVKWTVSAKLCSFFYQFRMRDIMCNTKLVHMKKKISPECEWCGYHTQNQIHLFWDCPVSQKLWAKIEFLINNTFGCKLEIKKELIFLFDIEAGNLTNIIDLLILITNRYIFVCKCTESKPSGVGLERKVRDLERLERSISLKNNKLMLHFKKWGNLAPRDPNI